MTVVFHSRDIFKDGYHIHVLDGLLYHQSGLRIEEHYSATTGFTYQVFA